VKLNDKDLKAKLSKIVAEHGLHHLGISVYNHSSEKPCFEQKTHMVLFCLYCLNCTKFSQLIPRKIIEIVAN